MKQALSSCQWPCTWEGKRCFNAVAISNRTSRSWLWCAGSHGQPEGWLLLSLQVLFQRDRLREVKLNLLVLESLANIMCHNRSLGKTLQMVTFSCHQDPAEQRHCNSYFLWMEGWEIKDVLQLSMLFSHHGGVTRGIGSRPRAGNDLPLLIRDRKSLKISASLTEPSWWCFDYWKVFWNHCGFFPPKDFATSYIKWEGEVAVLLFKRTWAMPVWHYIHDWTYLHREPHPLTLTPHHWRPLHWGCYSTWMICDSHLRMWK